MTKNILLRDSGAPKNVLRTDVGKNLRTEIGKNLKTEIGKNLKTEIGKL
jgi:hypothetical protein